MMMNKDRPADWAWIAALVAGSSFCLAAWSGWSGPGVIAWKGAGVGLLALWAGLQARSLDGWAITGALVFYAVGDVILDAVGLGTGAVFFLVGHVLAIGLYLRHWRRSASLTQRMLGAMLVVATPLIAWRFTGDIGATGYSLALGLMAASAWNSDFPRYRVGIGAVLFVASDLLIFARLGPLAGSSLPTLLVWPLYFTGVALIARGVMRALAPHAGSGWQR